MTSTVPNISINPFDGISFFNDSTTAQPTVVLKASAAAQDQANVQLLLPTSLPTSNDANIVVVDKDTGQLEYTSAAASGISGEFELETQGAVGLSDSISIDAAMTKIDTWIFRNLVDHPPAPRALQFVSSSATSVTAVWEKPTIYQLGVIDKTIPYITDLNIDIFKSISSRQNVSGSNPLVNASGTTITGTGTQFDTDTTFNVGDSITVQGEWSHSSSPTVQDSDNTAGQNVLKTTGWEADPSTEVLGSVFVIAGRIGRYTVTSVSGTYVDNSTSMSLVLDRHLQSTPPDGEALVLQETKVVTEIIDDTTLRVDSPFSQDYTAATATYVRYAGTSQTIQLTDTNYIPRENSTQIVEAFTLHIDSGSNTVGGTVSVVGPSTKHVLNSNDNNSNNAQYTYSNTDLIKLDVYYGNHNSGLTRNTASIADLEFVLPSPPSEPHTLTTTSTVPLKANLTWSSPTDTDSSVANSTTPAIDNYKITFSSNSLGEGIHRFGGAVTDGESTLSVSGSTLSTTLDDLQCGQAYSVSVKAKNTLNANYGPPRTDTVVVALPVKPSTTALSTGLTLDSSYTYASGSARLLTSTSPITTKIVDSTQFTQLGNVQYNTLNSVVVNFDQSELSDSSTVFQPTFGGTVEGPLSTLSITPFANPMPFGGDSVSTTPITLPNTQLHLFNQHDSYNNQKAGYWSDIDIDFTILSTSIPPSTTEYIVGLNHIAAYSSTLSQVDSVSDSFYVDDLANRPSVGLVSNLSFGGTPFRVSGVTSLAHGFSLQYDVDVQHLGRRFIRNDKLATARLRSGSTVVSSDTVTSPGTSVTWAYNDNTVVSSPILSSKLVRLTDTVTYNTTDIFTNNSMDTNLTMEIQPYNIKGDGDTKIFSTVGQNMSGLYFDTSGGKSMYVDTVSQQVLSSYVKLSSTISSGVTVNYGAKRVVDNSVATPSISSAADIVNYDHAQPITGNATSASYDHELQFANGRHRTKASAQAYIDYTTAYLNIQGNTLPNYSTIASNAFRYATFEFDLSSNPSTTISALDIQFHDFTMISSIASDGVIDPTKFQLYIKLIDNSNYSPSSSNYTTVWLDGNTILDGGVTVSQATWGSNEPRAALVNASSGSTSASTQNNMNRTIKLVTGTPTANLVVLVRIGLYNDVDNNFGYVTVRY